MFGLAEKCIPLFIFRCTKCLTDKTFYKYKATYPYSRFHVLLISRASFTGVNQSVSSSERSTHPCPLLQFDRIQGHTLSHLRSLSLSSPAARTRGTGRCVRWPPICVASCWGVVVKRMFHCTHITHMWSSHYQGNKYVNTVQHTTQRSTEHNIEYCL